MKNFLAILPLALCFSIGGTDLQAASYPPLTSEESAAFQQQVNQAIARAEARVRELEANATRKDLMPTWNSKLELQNAIIQLEVKKTLVGNFHGADSLRSTAVRQALLELLNKSDISTGDLASFQTLVLEEKAKIRAVDAAPKTIPAPAVPNDSSGP